MNLQIEFSTVSEFDRLCEAKRQLVSIKAEEIRLRRDLTELRIQITQYEGYAAQALEKGDEQLANDIALKIVSLESNLDWLQKINTLCITQVSQLKDALQQMQQPKIEDLQYTLDYLEAANELADDDWALQQKMQAAGIGPKITSAQAVLSRIRKNG
jgi:phage shock protein A